MLVVRLDIHFAFAVCAGMAICQYDKASAFCWGVFPHLLRKLRSFIGHTPPFHSLLFAQFFSPSAVIWIGFASTPVSLDAYFGGAPLFSDDRIWSWQVYCHSAHGYTSCKWTEVPVHERSDLIFVFILWVCLGFLWPFKAWTREYGSRSPPFGLLLLAEP